MSFLRRLLPLLAAASTASLASAQTCERETVLEDVGPAGGAPFLRTPLGAPVAGADFAFRVEGAQPLQAGALLVYDSDGPVRLEPQRVAHGVTAGRPLGLASDAGEPLASTFFTTDLDGSSPLLLRSDGLASELCGTDVLAVAVLFDAASFPSWSAVTNTLRLRVGRAGDILFDHLDVGFAMTEMVVADVDGDGLQDLLGVRDVVPGLDDTMRVRLGLETGGYGSDFITALFGYAPQSLAVADFDGDGRLDVTTASLGSALLPGSRASLFLGDGTGFFSSTGDFPTGAGARAVAVADFDLDGDVDAVTADFDAGTLSVLLGDGLGGLGAPLALSVGVQPYDVAAADLDGNGYADLVATLLGEASVGFVLGTGPATFDPVVKRAAAVAPISVVVADFDEDAVLDVLNTNNSPGSLTLFRGTGGGGFAAAVETPIGTEPMGLAVGDLDRDGHLDLAATGYFESVVTLARGDGTGSFQVTTVPTVHEPEAIAIADVDRNGVPDVIVTGGLDRTCVHLATEPGVLPELDGSIEVLGGPHDVVLGRDLDGDGRADLLAGSGSSGSTTVLLAQGDGSFASVQEMTGFAPVSADLLDLSGDGLLDLVDTEGGSLLVGNGDGTFSAPAALVLPGALPTDVFADFDGDDLADVVMNKTLSPKGLQVFHGNGDGTFGALLFEVVYGVQPTDVVAGDLNGDGNQDIVLGDPTFSRIVYAFGDGAGGIGVLQEHPTAGIPSDLRLADLDGDGAQELLFGVGALAKLLPVASSGVLGPLMTVGPVGTSSALEARLADLNGDGVLDVVGPDSVLTVLDGFVVGMRRRYCRADPGTVFTSSHDVADLDLDGIPDVVVAGPAGVRIHPNRLGE